MGLCGPRELNSLEIRMQRGLQLGALHAHSTTSLCCSSRELGDLSPQPHEVQEVSEQLGLATDWSFCFFKMTLGLSEAQAGPEHGPRDKSQLLKTLWGTPAITHAVSG